MVLNYATCNTSMGSLFTVMGEQRVNITFCVKLGKSVTETYSKCMVMKCYHVHVCLNGKRFHEGWETTEDDGRSGRPSTMCISEKIWASPDSSCNKIVKILSKCQISWTSARWPAMKFCTRILAREKWMLTHARARGGLFCNLCQPIGNCKQKGHILLFHCHWLWNTVPTVRTTSKNTRCRVERHKPTCLKETLHPALKIKEKKKEKKIMMLTVFFDCRGKEFVPKGQTVNQDVYIGVLQRSCNSILYCHPEL